ncbi:MAG TPA: hypothetical protein VFZ66_03875 [Herpetosiphonaceae bacterium]
MEYHPGRLIISSEDVARLFAAAWRAWRSLHRRLSSIRRVAPPIPARFGYYRRLYAEMTSRELIAARALLEQGQIRAAGALAGVALELHLKHIAAAHQVSVRQRATIVQVQEALRAAGVLHVQHGKLLKRLTRMRNQCVHARPEPPSRALVERLIAGVEELRHTLR